MRDWGNLYGISAQQKTMKLLEKKLKHFYVLICKEATIRCQEKKHMLNNMYKKPIDVKIIYTFI